MALPEGVLLAQIDRYAEAHGLTRSGFLTKAADGGAAAGNADSGLRSSLHRALAPLFAISSASGDYPAARAFSPMRQSAQAADIIAVLCGYVLDLAGRDLGDHDGAGVGVGGAAADPSGPVGICHLALLTGKHILVSSRPEEGGWLWTGRQPASLQR